MLHLCNSDEVLSECLACNEHLLRPDLVDMAAKKYFVCVQGAVRQRRSLQNTVRDLVQPQLRILLTPMLRVAMLARGLDAEGGDASSSRIATILNGVLLTQFTWADARSYSVIDQDHAIDPQHLIQEAVEERVDGTVEHYQETEHVLHVPPEVPASTAFGVQQVDVECLGRVAVVLLRHFFDDKGRRYNRFMSLSLEREQCFLAVRLADVWGVLHRETGAGSPPQEEVPDYENVEHEEGAEERQEDEREDDQEEAHVEDRVLFQDGDVDAVILDDHGCDPQVQAVHRGSDS
uniref:Uncharacterized protein n=1 Tax=Timema bartmani TaxID=61472 RepID=A0A7R9EQA4_9NEOP|nr:unnamed protein product [Timema bartmani]